MDKETELHTINSSLVQQRTSKTPATMGMARQEKATVALLLSKLAVHYYRPDFTEGQARQLIGDMVEDLAEYRVDEIERAITAYRRQPPAPGKAKYFPDSGTLRNFANIERRERIEAEKAKPKRFECGESRPIMWWTLPANLWRSHWQESEIPVDHWDQYALIKAKRAQQAAA